MLQRWRRRSPRRRRRFGSSTPSVKSVARADLNRGSNPFRQSPLGRELRLKLPSNNDNSDIVFYLGASDLGDGNENDFVSYQQPRIEFDPATKIPPVMLRDVNTLTSQFEATVTSELKKTASYLAAVRKLGANPTVTVEQIAKEEKLDHDLLESWDFASRFGNESRPKNPGDFTRRSSPMSKAIKRSTAGERIKLLFC